MTIPPTRIIDTKLPLTWLLSTAGGLVLALGAFALNNSNNTEKMLAKIEMLTAASAKLEKRFDDRDEKADAARDRMNGFDRTADNLKLRVDALERRK